MNIKRVIANVLLIFSAAALTVFIYGLTAPNIPDGLAQTPGCQIQLERLSDREPEALRRRAEFLNESGDRCFTQRNYSEATQLYRQSLTILEKLLESYDPLDRESLLSERLYLETLYDLGLAHFSFAQVTPSARTTALVDAESVLRQLLERLNVFKFVDDLNGQNSARAIFRDFGSDDLESRTSRLLQRVLVDKGQPNEALLVSEAGRTIEVDKNIFYHLFWLYNQAWSRIDWNKFIDVSRQLSLRPSLTSIQQLAQSENATLISYSLVSDQEILIWVIQPTGQITFRRVPLPRSITGFPEAQPIDSDDRGQQDVALAQLIRSARQSLGVSELNIAQTLPVTRGQQRQYLQQLYQILIRPIEDLLPTNPESNIIFLPQGPLFFVPFSALQNASREYLIQRHTIRTAPNLRTLLLSQQNQTQSASEAEEILIVGNPTMPRVRLANRTDSQTLMALPGAENEAREIAQLFESHRLDVNLLVNSQATEKRVTQRMEDARIIHLATHGLIDTTFQELGGTTREASGAIALAPSDDDESDEDGLLTAPEILKLRLNADLVVLSACNTGRGQLTAGGVIGLPFSLSIAGVRNMILSLWSVPDDSTEKLMIEFYTQLLKPDGNKARALRQAMLKVMQMQEYRDPKYWAAFTLTGTAD